MRLRFEIADRLRITLSALDEMPVAEFNMTVALHADRARRQKE